MISYDLMSLAYIRVGSSTMSPGGITLGNIKCHLLTLEKVGLDIEVYLATFLIVITW